MLAEVMARAGLSVTDQQAWQLETWLQMLCEASQVQNLTGFDDPAAMASFLLLDSLAALPLLSDGSWEVVDVGTGAGVPGLPLAICLPRCRFTLVDSTARKARFVEDAVTRVGIENARVVNARAEDMGRAAHGRESFDVAVAKACAPLAVLTELTVPLLRPGGRLIAWKGSQAQEEIGQAAHALEQLNARVDAVREYDLAEPGETVQSRRLVVIERSGPLSDRYPRRAGMPAKRPL